MKDRIGAPLPPVMLGASLVTWGYFTEALLFAVTLALILDLPQLVPQWQLQRWDLSEQTIWRVWSLCIVLLIFTFLLSLLNNDAI